MNLSGRATIQQIISATTSTGAKPIPAVVDSHAAAVRNSAKVRDLGVPQGVMAAAVAAALQAGKDPAADPEVQRIVTMQAIGNEGVAQGVEGLVFDQFREVAHEHADALVKSWRAPFDKAVGVLAAAHKIIGDLSLDDANAIMLKGGSIAATWGDARSSAATIDRIVMGWSALGEFTGLAGRDQRWNILRLAAVDLTKLAGLDQQGRRTSPWQAVLAGLDLSLPTFTEYHARVRVVERGMGQVQAQTEEDHRALMTNQRPKQVGPVVPGHVFAQRIR